MLKGKFEIDVVVFGYLVKLNLFEVKCFFGSFGLELIFIFCIREN